jgi:hypothetical protein
MNTRTLRVTLVTVLIVLFVLSLSMFGYANFRAGSTPSDILLSSLLLAVPLALLYFSIDLIVEAWLQHRSQGRVSPRMAKFLYRTPRIAGILIAVFTGLFALDVFDMEGSLWQKIGGFLIHAAPTLVMLIFLIIAWRREWVGAVVFGLVAIYFMRFVLSGSIYSFGNMLLFVLPMALVAVLFWLNWRWKAEIRTPNPS